MHFLLFVFLLVAGTYAFNVTHFDTPTTSKRAAANDTRADLCVLAAEHYDWARVSSFINVLADRVALAADLVDFVPAPTCGIASVLQGARSTMFAVSCVFAEGTGDTTNFFAELRTLFSGASTGAPLMFEENTRFSLASVGSFVQGTAARHLDRIDTRANAFDTRFHYHATGAGVKIYIIDTGIYEAHHDFSPARAVGLANTVDGSGPADCNGHGTHVASLAAGRTYGVAKDARIVAIKALDCQGYGSVFSISAALMIVQEQCEADDGALAVINLSVSGSGSAAIDELIRLLVARCHVAVVVAAGNAATDACLFSPSRAASAFAVGAVGATDAFSAFSNRGACVKMVAPGEYVRAAYPYEQEGSTVLSPSATASISGTSMASPIVAGTVALEMERMRACGWRAHNATSNGGTRALAMVRQLATSLGVGLPPLVFVPPYTWCASAVAPTPTPTPTPPPAVTRPTPVVPRLVTQSTDATDVSIAATTAALYAIATLVCFVF